MKVTLWSGPSLTNKESVCRNSCTKSLTETIPRTSHLDVLIADLDRISLGGLRPYVYTGFNAFYLQKFTTYVPTESLTDRQAASDLPFRCLDIDWPSGFGPLLITSYKVSRCTPTCRFFQSLRSIIFIQRHVRHWKA